MLLVGFNTNLQAKGLFLVPPAKDLGTTVTLKTVMDRAQRDPRYRQHRGEG